MYFGNTENRPFSPEKTENLIDELLLGIEHRGKHATGVAKMFSSGEHFLEKADIPADQFIKWRRELNEPSVRSILLHTRYATQGKPEILDNNHPIMYNETIAIHNGHISNDSELFKSENLKRNAQVDSEIIPAMFNKYGIDKAHIPLHKLDGGYAVAVVDKRNPNSLVLAKGYSSPLHYYVLDNKVVFWASTKETIRTSLKNVLNHTVAWNDVEELHLGEMLFFEDGQFEKLRFEPKPYEYSGSYNNRKNKNISGWSFYDWDDKEDEKEDKKPVVRTYNKPKKQQQPYKKQTGKGAGMAYISCEECNSLTQFEDAWEVAGFGYFCDDCYFATDFFEQIRQKTAEKTTFDSTDELEEEHQVVCELVGEKFGVSAPYVDWLLFDSGIEDGNIDVDTGMLAEYNAFSEAYDDFYDELLDDDEVEEDDEDIAGCFLEPIDGKKNSEVEAWVPSGNTFVKRSLSKWKGMVGL